MQNALSICLRLRQSARHRTTKQEAADNYIRHTGTSATLWLPTRSWRNLTCSSRPADLHRFIGAGLA